MKLFQICVIGERYNTLGEKSIKDHSIVGEFLAFKYAMFRRVNFD